jgi:hypothetical protein
VVTELRSARLRPEALSSIAPDLLLMVEAYEAILGEDGFTDWAGLLAITTNAAGMGDPLIPFPTSVMVRALACGRNVQGVGNAGLCCRLVSRGDCHDTIIGCVSLNFS